MTPITPAQNTENNPYATLENQLRWGPDHQEASNELAHLIPPHRLTPALWADLLDAYSAVENLRYGADPGFEDLGDGHYAAADPETALENAEQALENLIALALNNTPAHQMAA